MSTAAHRLLAAVLLALIGLGSLAAPGASAQDDPVGGAGDGSRLLGFPFPVGQSWGFDDLRETPVTVPGATSPAMPFYQLAPADQFGNPVAGGSIRAMRAGTVSLPCPGLVRINHGTFSTAYFPVASIAVAAGASVTAGQALGLTTAADITGCPGAATDGLAVVRVWIEQGGSAIDPIGMDIGGWTRTVDGIERGDEQLFGGNRVVNDGEFGSSPAPFAKIEIFGSFGVVVGDSFEYRLTGYPANTPVTVEFRRPNGTVVAVGTRTTNVAGAASGRFTVPATPGGELNTLVARTTAVTRTATVDVQPQVIVAPSIASRSGTVSVRLTGFPASVPVVLSSVFASGAPGVITPNPTTDAFGGLTTSYTVPAGAALGAASIRARYAAESIDVNGDFTIVGAATIALTPNAAAVGSQVTVNIRKYPANTNVTVALDEVTLGTPRTDANGNADFVFTVAEPGASFDGEITATAGSTVRTDFLSIRRTFDITTASAPPNGEAAAAVTGYRIGSLVRLEWSDGEIWQEIGFFPVAANRTITFDVPGGATAGTTITIRAEGQFGGQQDDLAITNPGTATPPIADAGPDQSVGAPSDAGIAVSLTGAGSTESDPGGSIVSYVWREDGNQIATGRTPTVTLTRGFHTIELTVKDNANLISRDTVVVEVGLLPVADAGLDREVNDPEGNGEEVFLDAGDSNDQDGFIQTYVWREGGNQIATGEFTEATLSLGIHTIVLTVTDNDGYTDTDTVVITVSQPQPPIANAGSDQAFQDGQNDGESVTLNGSGSFDPDGTISSYFWRENGSQIANTVSPTLNFLPGIHTVVLTVTDNEGLIDTDTVVITVTFVRPPVASAGPDQTVNDPENNGQAVILNGSGSTDPDGNATISSYIWREGTTQIATGVTPSVTLTGGVHSIVLTVTDNTGQSATDTVLVTVVGNRAPTANAGLDQTVNDAGAPNEAVTLNGSGSTDPEGNATIASYVWREATAQLATGVTPTITLTPGIHTLVLTVTDGGGLSATDTVVITVVAPRPPVANAGADQSVNDPENNGAAVTLNGSGSTDPDGSGTISSYVWTEGATQLAAVINPTVSLLPGTHTIVLTVTDNTARTATDTVVITVTGSRPPVANAGPDQTVADPEGNGQALTLNGTGSSDPDGTITSYVWREGSTQLATGASPSVTLFAGIHAIDLTVTDNAGVTATDSVVITVNGPRPPVANAGPDQTVNDPERNGQAVTLSGSGSTDPDGTIASYVWREGATQLATGVSPSVTLAAGVHPIDLTVTDNAGLTATDTVVITITAPAGPPTLALDKISSKFGAPVVATLTGFAPNSAVTLKWPRLFAVTATGPPSTDLLVSGTTDATGAVRLTFRTPLEPFLAAGYRITARDAASRQATATLRVIPRITLAPTDVGPTSTRLRVNFYGFSPNEQIDVRWHAGPTDASGFVVIKTLTVAATGRASSIVVIPASSVVGVHKVVGKVVGANRSASTPFTVTAGGGSLDDDATPRATRTATATATATVTPEPTETATPEPTETATPEPTVEPTPAPTETPVPTEEPTATPQPNASPVAAAGEDRTVTDADGTGDETVQLDGGASADPEGAELTYAWTVDGAEVATGATPSVALPVGATTVVLTVTDDQGATATDEVSIAVEAAPPAEEPAPDAGGAGDEAPEGASEA